MRRFNTQPSEGGWGQAVCPTTDHTVSTHSRPKAAGFMIWGSDPRQNQFQHTAARRRLVIQEQSNSLKKLFQHTAARRRLVISSLLIPASNMVSTHSRPKAAGSDILTAVTGSDVSTHSRPKAAGPDLVFEARYLEFQHTAARRRLEVAPNLPFELLGFQHTAARRRLAFHTNSHPHSNRFQHTAARRRLDIRVRDTTSFRSFNTQPPEGGWTPSNQS